MLNRASEAPQPKDEETTGIVRFVPSLYHVALAAVLGAILVIALAPRIDTDFWWHLKVGQYIVDHHVVPSRDFLSYTLPGHAWTDHEWLAETGMYLLYSVGGLWGPIVFFAGVICAAFGLVYLRMRSYVVNPVLALFVLAAAFVASSASWGPRIQMLTLLFLAAYMVILQRFDQSRDRRILIALPALMLLWANVHGGFVLGLVVILITIAGEWLNLVSRRPAAWSRDDLRVVAISLAATIGVTMLNPNLYRQLLYPLTFVLPNAYTNLIQESASPNFHLPVMLVFEALLLVLVAAFFVGRPRLNWTHLFLILAFTYLAFSQVRNVAIWAVVIGPLVALYLQAAIPALQTQFPRFTYRRRPVRGRIGPILNLALLALAGLAYAVEGAHFVNAATLRQAESDNFPSSTIAYMKSHQLPSHVLTSYSWGGYLLWNLYPRYRDYMDSRADTLFTNAILRDYLIATAAKPGWSAVLRRNAVQVVLIEKDAPLAQVLALDLSWRLIARDKLSVLYVHR